MSTPVDLFLGAKFEKYGLFVFLDSALLSKHALLYVPYEKTRSNVQVQPSELLASAGRKMHLF